MLGQRYTLDIRPTFIEELDRAAAYIELQLLNPVAADKLLYAGCVACRDPFGISRLLGLDRLGGTPRPTSCPRFWPSECYV